MNRDVSLQRIQDPGRVWDVIVIGGGATGLGVAVEAASRGLQTVLLEQSDFAKGTSSRSTKLIHGGLRYLKQGNWRLVQESLCERSRLRRNAPHLVKERAFLVPAYGWAELFSYAAGLKVYDLLAGRQRFGSSKRLSTAEIRERLPILSPEGLRGGVLYFDGQFDDARFAISLAQTLHDLGGAAVNYMTVQGLRKRHGRVGGVAAVDLEGGRAHEIEGRAVINAAGVFSDAIRALDDPAASSHVALSQGAHLVVPGRFWPGETALMIPKTDDARVLFLIPWQDRVLIGTTDTPVAQGTLEPRAQDSEIDYLLEHAARYLAAPPQREDILSVFAGLRPLVSSPKTSKTSQLSRNHLIDVSGSGLISVAGGKWTTYRKMGEDAIGRAAAVAGLQPQPSRTADSPLHGSTDREDWPWPHHWHCYGNDAPRLSEWIRERPELASRLHPRLPYQAVEVVWAARHEMARTVEDVLSRRTRALLLDANAAIEAALPVARLLAGELGRDEAWQKQQAESFVTVARSYLP